MTHTRQMTEDEGDFQNPWVGSDYKCTECGGKTQERAWDSSCGGYTDYKYRCKECGHTHWVDGPDS